MPTEKLDYDFVTSPPASAKRVIYWDTDFPGFGLDVKPSGHKSYVLQYRIRDGRTRRASFPGTLTLDAARKAARALQGDVARDRDPVEEKRTARRQDKERGDSFKVVAKRYMRQAGKGLRSRGERERILEKYLYPKLGNRPIAEIRRSEIAKVLDDIASKHGAPMSDHVLTVLRRVCNWYATKHDTYSPPFVKGMAKTTIKERARSRKLSDDEIRAMWRAADALAIPYSRFLQFVLLTAARRNEASKMPRAELSEAGTEWLIPAERYKTGQAHLVPLSMAAQEVLGQTPLVGNRWVFTNDGRRPLSSSSKAKRAFDKLVLAELQKADPKATLPRWTVHDLRRTARSLMSRAGVQSKIAELCMGHVIPGVEGIYDRHEYSDEKRQAFESLAGLLERIVNPVQNVLPIRNVS